MVSVPSEKGNGDSSSCLWHTAISPCFPALRWDAADGDDGDNGGDGDDNGRHDNGDGHVSMKVTSQFHLLNTI